MQSMLLAMGMVAFTPCGFELLGDGTTRLIQAPNLTATLINPESVVEIVRIDFGGEHEFKCVMLIMEHGNKRMIKGSLDEVARKLRDGYARRKQIEKGLEQ